MNIDMKKIGEESRKIREQRGLTQEDIAAMTGYSKSHISMYESGKTKSLPLFLVYRRLGLEISLKEVYKNGEKTK